MSPVRLGQTFADEDRVVEEHRHSGVTLLHELDVVARLFAIIGPALPVGGLVRTVVSERSNVDLTSDLMRRA